MFVPKNCVNTLHLLDVSSNTLKQTNPVHDKFRLSVSDQSDQS